MAKDKASNFWRTMKEKDGSFKWENFLHYDIESGIKNSRAKRESKGHCYG